MSCQKAFVQRLREQGFRLTPQREMVLSVLHDIGEFVTVEEIYGKVHNLSSSVDISTVYRTLDLLQEFNLVTSLDPGDGQRRYLLLGIHGPHLHLVCQSCGQVIGTELAPLQPLADYLQEQHGFELDIVHLSLPGLCLACVQARKRGAAQV